MTYLNRNLLAVALLAATACAATAATSTKDIVLDRVLAPVAVAAPARAPASPAGDAMAVSVLLESPDGTLTPKSTNTLFRTGDRFRVKLMASRDAKVSLYNTNPKGETNPKAIWQGDVKVGLDTVTPRMSLTGNSGIDQLHIVMEPAQESSVAVWLGNWLRLLKDGGGASKDIQLDVQNTPSATYLLNGRGQGLVNTMQIVHTSR
ncbi:MAG: hypothetical protein KAY82_02515 [Hylemonella sp.]|jgi:hypothetical protein|nr:hypothetical protein [Hylemonella sp.]